MSEQRAARAAELDEADWNKLTDILRRFEDAWQTAPDPNLARFLPPSDDPLRERVLVELIKEDQEQLWRSGRRRTLEAYYQQWPELRGKPDIAVELLAAECLTRAVLDAPPTPEELQSRFPKIAGRIDLAAIEAQAKSEGPALPVKLGRRFGRYEIRALLGQGGMGTVYRAYDTQLGREVALKIPREEVAADPAVVRRFVREARAAAAIEHPNICPIYDAGEIDGTYYITMGLIKGRSLAAWTKQHEVAPAVAAEWVRKLAEALEVVHRAGVIHRDVKAANVMIRDSGEPVLMDFGLARPVETVTRPTGAERLLGTIAYMSPEQAAGEVADARSDVYSLGVLLFELVTGRLPFEGPPLKLLEQIRESPPPRPRRLRSEVDATLEAVCLKAMAKRRDDRHQSAAELADALARYGEGSPQPATRTARRRRSRRLVALAAILLAAGGVLAVVGVGRLTAPPAKLKVEKFFPGIEVRPGNSKVNAVALSPDGSKLYAGYWNGFSESDPISDPIAVYSTADLSLVDSISYGKCHAAVAVSADGRFLYAPSYYEGIVSRFDLANRNLRRDLAAGSWAESIGLSPDGKKLVVCSGSDGGKSDRDNDAVCLYEVSSEGFSLLRRLELPDEPTGEGAVAFSPDSKYAYFATRKRRSAEARVYRVSLAEPYKLTFGVVPGSNQLTALVVSRNRVFIADRFLPRLWSLDRGSLSSLRWIDVPHVTENLVMHPDGKHLFLLHHRDAAISVLDLDRREVIARLSDVNPPFSMTFSADGRTAYVAHSGGCGDERLGGISVLRVDLDAGGRSVLSPAALAASLLLVAGGLILLFRRRR